HCAALARRSVVPARPGECQLADCASFIRLAREPRLTSAEHTILRCNGAEKFVDLTCCFVHSYKMTRQSDSDGAGTRKPNMREAILWAAEELFSTNGFNAVSIRHIAQAAGANPGSVTYHFKTKDGLLLEIYRRHCGPMNRRRSELLAAARRVRDL